MLEVSVVRCSTRRDSRPMVRLTPASNAYGFVYEASALDPSSEASTATDDVDDVLRLGDRNHCERRSLDGRQPLEMNTRLIESVGIQERALELPQLAPEHLVVRPRDAAKLDAPHVDSIRGLLRVADRRGELQDERQQKRTNEAQATGWPPPTDANTDDSMAKLACGSQCPFDPAAEDLLERPRFVASG